jgi:ABC-2 type transport system ATP-binding protein
VTADHLVVIQKGRLVADCPTDQLLADEASAVMVVTPERNRLAEILSKAGGLVEVRDIDTLVVSGLPSPKVGELALKSQVLLHQLTPQQTSLEEAFLELTESFGSAS